MSKVNCGRDGRPDAERHTQSAGAVHSGWLQLLLSASILGSGHHFHGFGDLLDVLDRLQPDGDWRGDGILIIRQHHQL